MHASLSYIELGIFKKNHNQSVLFLCTTHFYDKISISQAVLMAFTCFDVFLQGETFEWPEKVPFRLTHNLVEAMVSLF